jgi:hypothetical protein
MNHAFTLKYKRGIIMLFAAACMFYSCSVIRVLEVDSPSADRAGSGQHFGHHTIITTSLWKGRTNKQDLKSQCPNGISRVKVTTKPMDVILGFITAGFVVKQRLDWDCSQRSGSSNPPR